MNAMQCNAEGAFIRSFTVSLIRYHKNMIIRLENILSTLNRECLTVLLLFFFQLFLQFCLFISFSLFFFVSL